MPAYPSARPVRQLAASIDEPAVNRSPAEARIRGFGAGALEALANLMGGDDPSSQLMGVAGPLGMVASPARRFPQILEDVFAANPAARGAYERAQAAQMAEADQFLASQAENVLGGLPARQEATLGAVERANRALHGLAAGSQNVTPRPVPTRTGFETAIPVGSARPPISGKMHRGPNYNPRLATTKE